MSTTAAQRPAHWAADLTKLLSAAFGPERFPVDVERLALDYSAQRWPADPVMRVEGDSLPGFEGALVPIGKPRVGWGILYNRAGISRGRIRFTLAHELGHYLMHREVSPTGIRCSERAVLTGDGLPIEREADVFAASLLMPFDDFRARIPARKKPDLDSLGQCANRYGVSLIAVVLRWLEYTERRSMLVVSRDGFILWSRSSPNALKSNRFIRASKGPVEVPPASAAGRSDFSEASRAGVQQPIGVWFDEAAEEITVRSKAYDLVVTLLHFSERDVGYRFAEVHVEDALDRFMR